MGDKVPIETYNHLCKSLDIAEATIKAQTKTIVKQDKMLGETNKKIQQLKRKKRT